MDEGNISVGEFFLLVGAPEGVAPGGTLSWASSGGGGGVRASLAWDRDDDVIRADVVEWDGGGVRSVVRIDAAVLPGGRGMLSVSGEDAVGEDAAPGSARALLRSFARQVAQLGRV